MSDRDDRGESRRTVARRAQRMAGDRSARLAKELMGISEATLRKLGLELDLRDVITRARAIPSLVARRRGERALAGELRRHDLRKLAARLASVQSIGNAEPELFHRAEQWRARLIEEGLAAAAELPGGAADPLPNLIAQARRERDTGRPPGAARALFRHVHAVLKAAASPPEPERGDAEE